MLKITLIKSPIGYSMTHKRTCQALGLTKMHKTVTQPDNKAVRGMVHKVAFLVKVEEVAKEGN